MGPVVAVRRAGLRGERGARPRGRAAVVEGSLLVGAMEQQRSPRAPFSGWVELTAGGHRRLGAGCDLSAGGIGLELRGELPAVGGPVTSEFTLPGISIPLALEGRVAWSDRGRQRVGVCFVQVDPGLAELLENFVGGRL